MALVEREALDLPGAGAQCAVPCQPFAHRARRTRQAGARVREGDRPPSRARAPRGGTHSRRAPGAGRAHRCAGHRPTPLRVGPCARSGRRRQLRRQKPEALDLDKRRSQIVRLRALDLACEKPASGAAVRHPASARGVLRSRPSLRAGVPEPASGGLIATNSRATRPLPDVHAILGRDVQLVARLDVELPCTTRRGRGSARSCGSAPGCAGRW